MKKCILILDNIRSVENTGSIFRTADCLGVSKIILVGTTPAPIDRFGRKRKDFSKVSLGAEDFVPWEQIDNIQSTINNLKKEGYKIIALEQDPRSTHLTPNPSPHPRIGGQARRKERGERFVLIVGNEVDGISRLNLDICDHTVEIPMRGQKESMNVSVATGIALYALTN